MAGLKFSCTLPAPITAGTSGGWKTLLMYVVPNDARVLLDSWGVYPMGTVNSDQPIRCRLIRTSNQGTGGNTGTPAKLNTAFPEAVSGTFKYAGSPAPWTVEPTDSGSALQLRSAHPQGGSDWPALERGAISFGENEIVCVQYWNDGGGASVPLGADLCLEI